MCTGWVHPGQISFGFAIATSIYPWTTPPPSSSLSYLTLSFNVTDTLSERTERALIQQKQKENKSILVFFCGEADHFCLRKFPLYTLRDREKQELRFIMSLDDI